MSESGNLDIKLNWLVENAKRLDWYDTNCPYHSFYEALCNRVNNSHGIKDLELICIWTSGRVAEGYAFLLEPLLGSDHSSWNQLELLGEICSAMKLEMSHS